MSENPITTESRLFLKEVLPQTPRLGLPEFQRLAIVGCGLRSTTPAARLQEVAQGVEGDYIILSNLPSFIRVKDSVLDRYPYPGSKDIVRDSLTFALIKKGKFDELEFPEQLPERFNMALYSFLLKGAIRALPWQFSNPKMTVEQLIEELPVQAAPALLLIRHNSSIRGYDKTSYFGFGKNGKSVIVRKKMIDSTSISDADVQLLKRRYGDYLDQPVIEEEHILVPSGSNKRIISYIDEDTAILLLNHSLDMIRRFLASVTIPPNSPRE